MDKDLDPTRCIERVADGGRSVSFHQCLNNRGHGPEGKHCKLHAPPDPSAVETWWGLSRSNYLQSVKVYGSTRTQVILRDGRREAKRTRWLTLYPTKKEAVTVLLGRLASDVRSAKTRLKDVHQELKDAQQEYGDE